jgi:hypothetical protein
VDKLLNESGCDWVDIVFSEARFVQREVLAIVTTSGEQHRPKSKIFQWSDGVSSARGRGDRGESALCWEDSLPSTSFYCDQPSCESAAA